MKSTSADSRATQTVKAQLKLRQLILDGQLKAGERVPELSLVERTGVSRTPIRSALMRLADEGLLEALPTGGFVVRSFDQAEVLDSIDIRGTLEGTAARRAAERRLSSAELAELRDCVGAMDSLVARRMVGVEQFFDYVRLNELFHTLLIELAQSAVLQRTIDRIVALPFASPSAFVMAQATLPEAQQVLTIAQEHHRAILDAIQLGEGARAESLAREHSHLAIRNLQSASQRTAMREHVAGGKLIRFRPQ